LIALGASGRLVIFKPEKSLGRSTGEADKDLVIEKRGAYKKKVVSLNIYEGENFQQLLSQKIKPEENFYLMFVDFDVVKQSVNDNFWVIPSLDLESISVKTDFSKFLMAKKDFIEFLIETLA